jgi:hypothetical protein
MKMLPLRYFNLQVLYGYCRTAANIRTSKRPELIETDERAIDMMAASFAFTKTELNIQVTGLAGRQGVVLRDSVTCSLPVVLKRISQIRAADIAATGPMYCVSSHSNAVRRMTHKNVLRRLADRISPLIKVRAFRKL